MNDRILQQNKAEDRAKETYPLRDAEHVYDEERVIEAREYFVQGYKQAEKDLELTWEDIQLIVSLDWDLDHSEFSCGKSTEEYYKEVLKQFKDERKK